MNLDLQTLKEDVLASFVVFLVALPLCMGIALASGVPPIIGLVAGALAGLVVGALAGSPLQVSGPAAGLAVMVFEIVEAEGTGGLTVILVVAGIFQVLCALAHLGPLFRAISPAVIKGMLAGIGVLIFSSQVHVMLDHLPTASGVTNLLTIPTALWEVSDMREGPQHVYAAGIGLLTIISIVGWNIFSEKIGSKLPAPLIAIVLAVSTTYFLNLPIKTVEVPSNLLASLQDYAIWNQSWTWKWSYIFQGLALGFIATTETLLCVTAIDQITKTRSHYNKELFAQGVGNTIAGIIGCLPITGVIVRSSANVEAGGRTRLSAVLHGLWLVIALWLLPELLAQIPTAALAAILVYIGYKLVKWDDMKSLFAFEKSELMIYCATIFGVVTVNLLYGVVLGFMLALVKLLWKLSHIELEEKYDKELTTVAFRGSASFLTIPRIAKAIEAIPPDTKEVVLNIEELVYMDHAIQELISDWENAHDSTVRVKVTSQQYSKMTPRIQALSEQKDCNT